VRAEKLQRAIASVLSQTRPVTALSVAIDHRREGSATTRTRALAGARTEWVAFLDDDDVWYDDHVEKLTRAASDAGADVAYSPCRAFNGDQVTWESIGQPFDPVLLYERPYIYVTSLVHTELAQRAGFDADWDEWGFYRRLHRLGARFTFVPDVTWEYRGGQGTAGQPHLW
jgi:glycosyltransferase involved in cell wall biosynthesis